MGGRVGRGSLGEHCQGGARLPPGPVGVAAPPSARQGEAVTQYAGGQVGASLHPFYILGLLGAWPRAAPGWWCRGHTPPRVFRVLVRSRQGSLQRGAPRARPDCRFPAATRQGGHRRLGPVCLGQRPGWGPSRPQEQTRGHARPEGPQLPTMSVGDGILRTGWLFGKQGQPGKRGFRTHFLRRRVPTEPWDQRLEDSRKEGRPEVSSPT